MATISTPTSSITCASLAVHGRSVRVSSSSVIGLPAIAKKGKVKCSTEGKPVQDKKAMSPSLMAAMYALTTSSPAMALVDERMSTEGTGLPFGLSNNILAWVILGVFALIWSLYTVYTSTLDDDEESGLSL